MKMCKIGAIYNFLILLNSVPLNRRRQAIFLKRRHFALHRVPSIFPYVLNIS